MFCRWRVLLRCCFLVGSSDGGGEESESDGRQRRRSFFGGLTEHHFKHSQLLTPDELDNRMRSISVIATRCVCVREREDVPAERQVVLVQTHVFFLPQPIGPVRAYEAASFFQAC